MKIPKGMTESQVVDIIDNVANRLAARFKFGYHSIEDMKQEARLYAWMALPKYDNKRPLENFLWTHVRNRLYNLKRNKFERPDLPCERCPFNAYDPEHKYSPKGCTKFDEPENCELYAGWLKRNRAKKNIMMPIDIGGVKDDKENNMKRFDNIEEIIDNEEMFLIIEREMPIEMHSDWIKMRYDIRVPKPKREKIISKVKEILQKHYADD